MSLPQPMPQAADGTFDREETLKLALARHQAGEREEAECLYLLALAVDPKEPTALYLYGLLNLEAGLLDEADRMLGQVVELRPGHAEGHVALANVAHARGRREEAIEGYRRALRVQPGHPVALNNLGALLRERGLADDVDVDGAIEVCRSAIAVLEDPAPAYALLGRLLSAAGRHAEAIEAYCAALERTPTDSTVLAGLALAVLSTGDGASALRAADAALGLDQGLVDAWFARGGALMALHRPRDAAGAFECGVSLRPDEARLRLALGNAYAELDCWAPAIEHLTRALELDSASTGAHANLGSVYYRSGDLENAERHCRLALAGDPNLVAAHRNLAGILTDRGELEQARRHRDAAFSLNNLFIESAPRPKATVLLPTTADSGNIPHQHLLPSDRYSRIDWFIEYAREGQAEALPPYDLVFNIIGDPDYAAATEAPVAAFRKRCERPWLNDPEKVASTRRDRLPALLDGIADLVVPKVARFEIGPGGLRRSLTQAGFSTPVLIRPVGSHGGKGLTLARDAAELAAFGDAPDGVYATEFVDYQSPDDGFYRKYRMIFIDRKPYPYHLAISARWLVHYESAAMPGDARRQAEELRFLQDPAAALGERALVAVGAIGRRLDLDYAGVDFSILPDGRVLVFEANATMLVHPEADSGELASKNPFIARITDAFQALVEERAGA